MTLDDKEMARMLDEAIQDARRALVDARDDALRVYEANRAGGSPGQSVAFDSGRYDGLKQAIETVDAMTGKTGATAPALSGATVAVLREAIGQVDSWRTQAREAGKGAPDELARVRAEARAEAFGDVAAMLEVLRDSAEQVERRREHGKA